jgi:hypothetical protein
MKGIDREIPIGKNRLFLGQDNLLYIIRVGEASEQAAMANKEAVFKLTSLNEGKVNVFVDLDRSKKASPVARRTWQELSEHEKYEKIPLSGLHPVVQSLASFAIVGSKAKDFRYFKKKEKVLSWLLE